MHKEFRMKKSALLLPSIILLSIMVVGGTIALLLDQTDSITNKFLPSDVPVKVWEETGNGYKEDVQIQNDGNVPAFIRAKVIINWIDAEGKVIVGDPEGYTKTVEFASVNWEKLNDGYYYYKYPVDAKGFTDILLDVCRFETTDTEQKYKLQVDIIAQSIQAQGESADGKTPVEEVWGVTIENGTVTKYIKEETNQ